MRLALTLSLAPRTVAPCIASASSSTGPLQLLPVLFGISIVTFVLVHAIPGDPVRAIIGPKATPEVIERMRAQYGLDQPVLVQYLYFLKNLARGEMGRSIVYKMPVLRPGRRADRRTVFLLAYGVVLALMLTAAARRRSRRSNAAAGRTT